MKRITLNTAALLLLSLASAGAQEKTNAIPTTDFRAFELVVKRNIFDANRRAGHISAPKPEEKRPQIDSLSLLGTISYEKGLFAFFGGSSSAYRKVLGPDDTIAEFHIKEIAYDHVCLSVSNEPPVELHVGSQLRREEDGPWHVSAQAAPVVANSSSSSSDSSADSGSNDAENEILKRLMKKREQELNK